MPIRSQKLVDAYFARRHAVLFYSLLLTMAAAPLLSALHLSSNFLELFLALNLTAAVSGFEVGRKWNLVLVFMVVVVTIVVVGRWGEARGFPTAGYLVWIVLAVLAARSILRFIVRAEKVRGEHVYAALSAFLLAGVFFGILYWLVEKLWIGSFAQSGSTMAAGSFSTTHALYFSFVTLATLGYGDIVPVSDLARSLAIVEAVSGQLYLVVMVARLVSLNIQEK